MCGIAGRFNFNASQPVERGRLRAMTSALAHRTRRRRLLLRRRNRPWPPAADIIDLATGDQPLANEDATVWTVFNGDLQLRRDPPRLETHGHVFKTNSDTEVIVHGYEQWEVLTR
jgi:asparagine synthase (glutamine-hydrolysing)